jgi:hypothetical protein
MAATLTLVSASPHALKYRFLYDGDGSAIAAKTRAQLVADFADAGGPSPLKALLANAPLTDWICLDDGPQLSLYTNLAPVSPTSIAVPVFVHFEVDVVDGPVLNVVGASGSPSSAIVEIRFHHTLDR